MPRALTILKYVPAVLCGLLVMAWVGSLFWSSGMLCWQTGFTLRDGNIEAFYSRGMVPQFLLEVATNYLSSFPYGPNFLFGKVGYLFFPEFVFISLPIPTLLTLVLPLAIGAFNRFRFPLWSWFAFTALVAVELAWYLRAC